MAAKVNVKFVVILAVGLLLLATGVGFLAVRALMKSGEDHERLGDRWSAEGDFQEAAKEYSEAVAEDRTNVRWLKKWRDALLKIVPATETEFRDSYQKHYMGILRQLAVVQSSDAQAQRDFFDAVMTQYEYIPVTGQAWTEMATMADEAVVALDTTTPENAAIRRYRGLASLYALRTIEPSREVIKRTREDLEAAVGADPNDIESALGLIELTAWQSSKSKAMGNVDESERLWADAEKMAADLAAAHPDSPGPALRLWELEVDRRLLTALTVPDRNQIRDQMAPKIDPVIEKALQSDSKTLSHTFLTRLQRAIFAIRRDDAAEVWLSLVERAREVRPDDPALLMMRAEALTLAGQRKESIAQYDEIAAMPDKPVSLEGVLLRMYRNLAMASAAEQALLAWTQAEEADKPEMMADVLRRREALAALSAQDDPMVLRVDALIAYNEKRWPEAIRLLHKINELGGSRDAGVLLMLSRALAADGSIGAALNTYDRVLGVDRTNMTAQLEAADLDLRLQNLQSAYERLKAVYRLDPTNTEIQTRVEVLQRALEGAGTVQDPLMSALIESRTLRRGDNPNFVQARQLLDRLLADHPDDLRVIVERISLDVQAGDTAAARALTQRMIDKFPNSQELQKIKISLEVSDPVEAEVEWIKQLQIPDLERALRTYQIYKSVGRSEDAQQHLDEAQRIDPSHPALVEILFVQHLEEKQFEKAGELRQIAAEKNLDNMRGLLYQARLEIAQEKWDSALTTLDAATREYPYSAASWRLLGQARFQKGQVDGALEAMRRAVDLRPNDGTMIRPYLSALIQLGRDKEALAEVKRGQKLSPNDPALTSVWLELEERFGDKNLALNERKRRQNINPDDMENNVAMARLMLSLNDWANATSIIEMLPKEGERALSTASLRSRWFALQTRVTEGVKVWDDYIATLTDRVALMQAKMAKAEFLLEFAPLGEAVAAFDAAREHQDPAVMEVDRRLGDVYFLQGLNAEAAEVYQRVLDGNADKDQLVAKRRIEALLRKGDFAEVTAAVDALEKAQGARDLQTILLRADAAAGAGDKRLARQLLDEAVAMAPTDPLPFVRRAQLDFADETQRAAVTRDIDQALRLRPGLVPARTLMAQLYIRQGRVDDALREIATAVELNPADDELRLSYLRELIRLERTSEARTAAAAAIEKRAADEPIWWLHAGDVCVRVEDFETAATYYQRAWDNIQSPEVLGRVVDALLLMKPPRAAEAEAMLKKLPPEMAAQAATMTTVLQARILKAQGKQEDALRMALRVWPRVVEDPIIARAWVGQVDVLLDGDSARIASLIEQAAQGKALPPHLRVLRGRHLMKDPNRWPETLASLEGVEKETKDLLTLLDLHRLRGQVYYYSKRYEDATSEYRAGLAIKPSDAEFNNNLAFTLMTHLGKADEAVPYAEKAAQADPSNPSILDTLGVLYYKTGKLANAEITLTRARESAVTDNDRASCNLHLAQVKAAQKDFKAARPLADEAKQIIEADPVLKDSYGAEMEQLIQSLPTAE